MQPYFMPYVGYFSLINAVDKFVLLDDVQFIRHGWIERNRILDSNKNWQYIKVPLIKHPRNTLIKGISINNNLKWKEKIFSQLVCYKKKAPYYSEVSKLLNSILVNDYNSITELNYQALLAICDFLEISTEFLIASKMNYSINSIQNSGDWALEISKLMNATTYINPIDGINLFDKDQFKKNKISIKFISPSLTPYNQKRNEFEKALSIIDVMMFNSKEDIQKIMVEFEML